MNKTWQENIQFFSQWLQQHVLPMWGTNGFDEDHGCFEETLNFQGEAVAVPRRAMVQCRQIYSFLKGAELGFYPEDLAKSKASQSADLLLKIYRNDDGSFVHSALADGKVHDSTRDLYTQAFVLFGLAQVYKVNRKKEYKDVALSLVTYLNSQRKVKTGGYTEIEKNGDITFKTNPHMHLFEGALAWLAIDDDSTWKVLCDHIYMMTKTKFINPDLGVLGEYFDENWNSIKVEGRFIYEPGHQFEWAWLLAWYEELSGVSCRGLRQRLYTLAEEHGINPSNGTAYDELWSDFTPKLTSSRFWPQCERIKAAVKLGAEARGEEKEFYKKNADNAVAVLMRFFQTPQQGFWYDQVKEDNTLEGSSSKASSLYHIINAIDEYMTYRPKL